MYEAYMYLSQDMESTQKQILLNYLKVWPINSETRFDVVSMRKITPHSYDHSALVESRRLFPSFQYTPGSFKVLKSKVNTTNTITVQFRTSGCLTNLEPMSLIGYLGNAVVTKVSAASPRVTGTFDLAWNDQSIRGINASVSAEELTLLVQSMENLGTVTVTRSKDCHGFKWALKWRDGGYKSRFTIPTNNLVGDNVVIESTVVNYGGVNFNPIPGTMLRTCKYDILSVLNLSHYIKNNFIQIAKKHK